MQRMGERGFCSFLGGHQKAQDTAVLPPNDVKKLKLLIQDLTLVNG